MMKYRFVIFLSFIFSLALVSPSCSQKSGCQANESLRAPVNKKGELKSSGKSKSGLFPKKMSKKMRK